MSSVAIQELQYTIAWYQKRISELQKEISELSKKKDALKQLELTNNKRTYEFWDTLEIQKMRLHQICETQTIRYAEGHKRNLEGYLTGNRRSLVTSSLDELALALKQGTDKCGDDIFQRQQSIRNYEREIDYLQERIRYLQMTMVQELI